MSDEKENKTLVEKDQQKNIEKKEVIEKKKPAEDKSKVKATEKPKSSGKLSFSLSFIILVIFAAGFVFINNRLNKIENELQQNELKNEAAVQTKDDSLKEVLSRFSSVQQRLEELDSKQEVLAHSLSQPVEQEILLNQDYALAEIEHLLIIASYNLQLDHNVATALSAMEAADARLSGLTNPAVISVREQLIADMNELRSINQGDLTGMALFLSDLIDRVDDLSLKENVVLEKEEFTPQQNEEPVEGIKHFFSLVFKELKSLIVITRDKDIGKARLLPDEVYFLRANLKLELANARFAVFNRDTENLRSSITHLQSWLNEYFDLTDADVRNIYDSLSSMKKMDLAFPDIDISSSLESVRALSHSENNGSQSEQNSSSDEEELIPQQ